MSVTRYWHNDKEIISYSEGKVNDSGSFTYNTLLGNLCIPKGYHFPTKNAAIIDSILEIDDKILELTSRRDELYRQYEIE